MPEGWGLDPAPVLTEIALRTARISLPSAIVSVWRRTPASLAMTAATLHQACGGRYVLGLGASTKALAEGFHDTAFEHPAAKLRDVVTKVRALLAGQPAGCGVDHEVFGVGRDEEILVGRGVAAEPAGAAEGVGVARGVGER